MNIKLNWEEFREREKAQGLEGQLIYTLRHSTKWEERDGAEVLCDFDWSLFRFVTGLDESEGCFNEVHYCKGEDGVYRLFFLYFVEGNVIYNAYFEFVGDVLHPYSEYGDMTVENFFNDNMTSVIQRLKDYAPDVMDEIEDRYLRSLTVPDLTCPLREEVRDDYLKNVRPSDFADYIEGCFPDLYNEIAERVANNIEVADIPLSKRADIICAYLTEELEYQKENLNM